MTDCKFEAGRLKDTGGRESLSYTVEVHVDGRKGNTSRNRLEDMDRMVERAVTLAKVGSVAHFDAYPSPSEPATVKTHSEKTLSLSREKMIEGWFVLRVRGERPPQAQPSGVVVGVGRQGRFEVAEIGAGWGRHPGCRLQAVDFGGGRQPAEDDEGFL